MNVAATEISPRRLASLTVAVLADHDVLARRLRLALSRTMPECSVVAGKGRAPSGRLDVVVRAGSGPLGAAVTGEAVLVEIVHSSSAREIREARARGARGIVRECDIEASLAETVRAALAGQLVLPAGAAALIDRPALSPREKQVLGLVVLGLSNREIAAKLHLTEATVKSHLTSSFRKLGVRTRSEASLRILDPESGLGLGILSITGEPGEDAA